MAGAIAPATALHWHQDQPEAKAPGQRPTRPWRALRPRRAGRWPFVVPGPTGLKGSVARGRGKRGSRFLFPPAPTKALSPLQWQRPSPLPQRHADPCQPGATAPGQRPTRPWRALRPRRVGRWPFRGAWTDRSTGNRAARAGETRVAFPDPAQRRSPFPRTGKSFPAGRRSDCLSSTLSDLHLHSRCDSGLSHQLNRCHAGWQGQRWRRGRVTCPSSLNDRRHTRETGMTVPFTGQGLPVTVAFILQPAR